MEQQNQMLFLLMNAGPHAAPGVVASAKVLAGAAGVAACTAWLVHAQGRRFVEPLTDRLVVIYRRVFAAFIRRGWVQR